MLNIHLALLGALYSQGLKQGITQFLVHAGYLFIAGLLFFHSSKSDAFAIETTATGILIVGSIIAWHLSYKRYRTIADTPTALLRSAAQGYVELFGRTRLMPGAHALVYGQLPPCLWYRVLIMENAKSTSSRKMHVSSITSDELFLLDDGSGTCVIDPEQAEVLGARTWCWSSGDDAYQAQYLGTGDPLYVIGNLHTLRGADGTLNAKADIAALLKEWKADKQSLFQRFDSNQDGNIDMEEWQRAVATADQEVAQRHRELRARPDINMIRQATDNRPFMLATRDPQHLATRFRYWSWFHAFFLISTCFATAWKFGQ